MKKTLLFLTIVSLIVTSCGDSKPEFNSNSGKILVEVDQVKDSITFLNTDSTLTSETDIQSLVNQVAREGQLNVKNPLTFKPLDCFIYRTNDTLSISVSFSAENSYGVPGQLTAYCSFVNKKMIQDKTFIFEK
jgi:hypothetical protein